uniref:Uncharacterized protein n=1 Tax=viral metagenome TaxID=1070528 RepID=A0A6C0KPN4_9ZZZZ
MFFRQSIINPEMSNYIRKSNNKYMENLINYNNKLKNKFKNLFQNKTYEIQEVNNIYFLLPFVSLVSFLAGYKYKSIL